MDIGEPLQEARGMNSSATKPPAHDGNGKRSATGGTDLFLDAVRGAFGKNNVREGKRSEGYGLRCHGGREFLVRVEGGLVTEVLGVNAGNAGDRAFVLGVEFGATEFVIYNLVDDADSVMRSMNGPNMERVFGHPAVGRMEEMDGI